MIQGKINDGDQVEVRVNDDKSGLSLHSIPPPITVENKGEEKVE